MVALNLLGVEAPSRFKEKYDSEVRKQKEQVLDQIRSRRNINQSLGQALKLGLHQEDRIFQLEPGITMNVPEYIRGQCKIHNLKIPE